MTKKRDKCAETLVVTRLFSRRRAALHIKKVFEKLSSLTAPKGETLNTANVKGFREVRTTLKGTLTMQNNVLTHSSLVNARSAENLADVSHKEKKWDKHRSSTQTIEDMYLISEAGKYCKLSDRMMKCSGVLTFDRIVDTSSGEVRLKFKNAKFCKVRHCPTCSWRRAKMNTKRFSTALTKLEVSHPNARWIFLTLTVKNPSMKNLRSTLNSMNEAWQRLIQLKNFPAIGFVRSTEVTRGKDGNPHPHFHCLLMVKPSYFQGSQYIKFERWQSMWKDAMRLDYDPVVDVRNVRPKSSNDDDSLRSAILETLKYAVKPEDMMSSADFLYGITEQLHKLRFLSTGGLLKDCLKETDDGKDEIAEEPSEDEDTLIEEAFFGWKRNIRRYQSVTGKTGLHNQQRL